MKISRFTMIILLLFALVLTAISIVPASAQDPVSTVEANPFVIVTEESAGSTTVEDGGLVINVEAPEAPETTNDAPANSIPTPVVAVGGILFGLVFLGLLYNMERIAKIIAPLMSPEAAIAIVTAALPTIMDAVMNNVARAIPTEIDDQMFIEAARQRGLTVARDPITGNYQTSRTSSTPYPPTGGTPLGTDLTGSGGAPGGSDAFPRTPNRNA